jgi:hypothetical protein
VASGGLIVGVENRDGNANVKFDSLLPEMNLWLVVQRTLITEENPEAESEGLFGTESVYRNWLYQC